MPYDLGIDELLFSYGVRLNKDLILNQSCAPIEMYTQPYGNQRKLERSPVVFRTHVVLPRARARSSVIDPIHTRFVSSLNAELVPTA